MIDGPGAMWHYVAVNHVPYNPLHDQFMPSIGCAPCTRAIAVVKTSVPVAGGGKTKGQGMWPAFTSEVNGDQKIQSEYNMR